MLDKNPCTNVSKHKEKSRERYVKTEEIPKFFRAIEKSTESNQMKDFIKLCLYTGARKKNVQSMRWEEINLEDKTWHIPDEKTKNGRSQTIPLIEPAVAILENIKVKKSGEFVFPARSKSGHLESPNKAVKRIFTEAGLSDLRIHDLRRTLGSWMAINGASSYVIGKTLNHKNSQSTDVYARLNNDPVREFMDKAVSSIEDAKTNGKGNTRQEQIARLKMEITISEQRIESLKSALKLLEKEESHE